MKQTHFGYAVREQNRAFLTAPEVTGVEFTFERSANALLPLRADDPLLAKPYRSLHALKLSPGSTTPPPDRYLDELAAFAVTARVDAVSDHIGITRHAGTDLGHFAPLSFVPGAVRAVADNCRIITERLERAGCKAPLFLENIAYFAPMFPGKATMGEAEFVGAVLRATGAGLLLDLENLHANSINLGYDPRHFIDCVADAASRVQIHLAGGHWEKGLYFDSHSQPVGDATWDLLRYAAATLPSIEAVFIERDANHPKTAQELLVDLGLARRILEGVTA